MLLMLHKIKIKEKKQKRPPQWEVQAPQLEGSPLSTQVEKTPQSSEYPA